MEKLLYRIDQKISNVTYGFKLQELRELLLSSKYGADITFFVNNMMLKIDFDICNLLHHY